MDKIEEYLQSVMADMEKTWLQHILLRPKEVTQPIPFFGDIKRARVLTIGVNPSAKEFVPKRGWPPEAMTASKLNHHLRSYFALEKIEPHKWFDTWRQALEPLGVSYKGDATYLAAHLDLSPRTTVSMGSANMDAFLVMMKEDAKWFFELLPKCETAQLLLVAGSVTGRYYMDEFIECVAYRYGFKLEEPPTPRGKGIGFNRLRGPGVDLPVFFCSVSPSARNAEMLPQRVEEHKEKLLELLNKRPGPATL